MITGAVLVSTSLLGSGFSTKFPHFLVTQGIFFGTGTALLYYPATGAITEWFNEKRPLALGLAASGSAVGGALWSTYIPKLNNKLPHGAIFLVIGGLAAPLLFLGCLLIRERKGAAGHDVSGDEVRPSERSIRAAVLEWRFLALTWSLVILNTGILIPFNFLVVYAREKEVSEDVAYNLVAYTYLGSIIGRIGSGLLADFFGCFNVLFWESIIVGVMTLWWIQVHTAAELTAFAVLFGIFSGGLVPMGSACVAQTTPDMGHIGLRIGVMMACCAVGALGGAPLSVALLNLAG
ncbi:hypothetical protein H634G_01176 [Metarhizium anisopliae BRIP 53293]|uniref:Major facilitator superfamily (MFS) profile domain-containing protein n=1 Tax=Metarhizium anisopliae BRIP 53293 TaxID=1291518 RepID=A0A0D9PA89_METAN|nr:hypothetical protein H634G_01176 [Metarhizium anisopliae BRIP 53293]